MRKIAGEIFIPSDCPIIKGAVALIEVRDVSRADALSTLVAQTRLDNLSFRPGDRIRFSLNVPEVSSTQSLDLRIHISCTGSKDIKSGDLLTTSSFPVPSHGTSEHISVLVKRV